MLTTHSDVGKKKTKTKQNKQTCHSDLGFNHYSLFRFQSLFTIQFSVKFRTIQSSDKKTNDP